MSSLREVIRERARRLSREMVEERLRQIEKFGAQHDVPCLDRTLTEREGGCSPKRMAQHFEIPSEVRAKFLCDNAFKQGRGTYAHIAVEELAEVIGAPTDEKRREELVQLATVCMGWIEAIDERKFRK